MFLVYFIILTISVTSCKKEVDGCIDSLAYNYNASANTDNGSCIYAHEIMVNTWNMETSECGNILGEGLDLLENIVIQKGNNDGDLIINLGTLGTLTGSISNQGSITIPSQSITLGSIEGTGTLNSLTNATVNIKIIIGFPPLATEQTCNITLTL